MRSAAPRPTSRSAAQSPRVQTQAASRKVFNCIVDDSALVAGVKKSTRHGIRQWVREGWVRIFVPLHALEQLARSRNGTSRHSQDVRDVMQWLDEATSNFPHAVTLQGGFDTYERWEEVERFKLPKTLFSETDYNGDADDDEVHAPVEDKGINGDVHAVCSDQTDVADLPAETETLTLNDRKENEPTSSVVSAASVPGSPSSLGSPRSSTSQLSPPTSPLKPNSSPNKAASQTSNVAGSGNDARSSASDAPIRLRPLINYILWRIHQEIDPEAALQSFIFLCNDPSKTRTSSAFGVRTKRLEELRNAIIKEDRDLKSRQRPVSQGFTGPSPQILAAGASIDDEDDEQVVFKPKFAPSAPVAMRTTVLPVAATGALIDPDAFGRSPATINKQPLQHVAMLAPRSPRPFHSQPNPTRGNHQQQPFAPRGTGLQRGTPRGRVSGPTPHRGTFNSFRGGFGASRGGRDGLIQNGNRGGRMSTNGVLPNGQIDPDSFERPRGRRGGFNGRGGGKLWSPETG